MNHPKDLYEDILNNKRSDSGIQGGRLTIYPRVNGNFDIGSEVTVEKSGEGSKTIRYYNHATDINGGEVLHQLAFLLADIHVPVGGTHAE